MAVIKKTGSDWGNPRYEDTETNDWDGTEEQTR